MVELTQELIRATLQEMWFDILDINQIDDKSDFFALGGDSMGAVTILAKIYEVFDVKISLEEFLMNRTFSSQAEIIYNKASQ